MFTSNFDTRLAHQFKLSKYISHHTVEVRFYFLKAKFHTLEYELLKECVKER